MTGYRKLDYEKIKIFAQKTIESFGISAEDSETVIKVLLESDLMGIESHGLQRLNMYCTGMNLGRINPKGIPEIVNETPVSAVIDAHEAFGQIAGSLGMNMAIEKAKKTGIGMVVIKNSTHYGIAGYYSMMAAKEGLLGMSMTNTEALVLPTFGKAPMLGTDPIALTMPADPYPLHIDMSTCVVPAGKMEVYDKKNTPVPEGWFLDANGEVATNPAEFIAIRKNKTDGGILPLGGAGKLHSGHKGYALAMIVELMTAVLSGGYTSNLVRKVPEVERCCHMMMAIDYTMFGKKEDIEKQMSDYMQLIRDSAKAKGEDRIYTHGEMELSHRDEKMREGVLVNDKTYAELQQIAIDRGISSEYIVVVG